MRRSDLISLALVTGVALGLGARDAPAQDHGHQDHDDDATVSHRFENAENWADRFEDPERDAWQLPGQVVDALITRDDLIVVDIGSATGYFPIRFAHAAKNGVVYGADIEAGMIYYLNDRARKEGLTNLVSIIAAPDDPHLPRPVDLVFICNTYHHINDRIDYFTRLREQLLPDARVAVVDFRPGSKRGPPHKLASEIVEKEMAEAGYEVAERHTFLPEQYFLVFQTTED